ncbi:hypothetical protein MRX96_008529 [Rhipicephalus microplus]
MAPLDVRNLLPPFFGKEHKIKLLPDDKPYGRQPYRCTASDRQFLERVRTYLDDIIIFTDTWSQFLDLLEETLTITEEAGFKVSSKKCKFAVPSVKFLKFFYFRTMQATLPLKDRCTLENPSAQTQKNKYSLGSKLPTFTDASYATFRRLLRVSKPPFGLPSLSGRPSVSRPSTLFALH